MTMADQTATTTTLLQLNQVSKSYHVGELDTPVLHDVNLTIRDGEMIVIVGPSGSGKSTLLNIIGGIDTPTRGEVWYLGHNLATMKAAELTEYRRHEVGYIFQFYNLIPSLTARENVQVTVEISDDPMDAAEALGHVGLESRLDFFPSQLSGGEQQRVAVARALAKNPRLLLCDEPTGALDFDTGRPVLELLVRLNRELGKTIIIITHNAPIADIANRMLHLASGRIVEERVNDRPLEVSEISW